MGQFEDMRVETADAPSASDFLVRADTATADYGVTGVDNAQALGAAQALGTDLEAVTNMAQTLTALAGATHGTVHALRAVNGGGERLPAVASAVSDDVRHGIAAWLKQRPEAAWRFLKRQTSTACESSGDLSDAQGALPANEGGSVVVEGTKRAAELPLAVGRSRSALHQSAEARLAQWDNKAVRQQRKADRIADKAATAGGRQTPFAKFRQRYHQSKAERLRGEGGGALGGVLRVRRKKNGVVASMTRRRFLVLAAGGIALVPLALSLFSSCTAGIMGGIAGAVGGSASTQGGSLTAVESQVASFLLGKGLDPLHVAAIMGNMFGESGMDPSRSEDGGTGIGICQWSGGRASALRSFAQSRGTDWTDLATQLDFLWDHDSRRYTGDWNASYTIVDSRVSDIPGDPAVGTVVSGSKAGFEDASDVDRAVEEFCYGWESPGVPRIETRKEAARRYLSSLGSLGAVSGSAQAVISAAMSQLGVAYDFGAYQPGVALDCSGLTKYAYAAAGIDLPHQSQQQMDACLAMGGYLVPSTEEARPGDLFVWHGVAGAGYGNSGHVAIYIGNNQIIEAAGYGTGVVISPVRNPTWICRFPSLA